MASAFNKQQTSIGVVAGNFSHANFLPKIHQHVKFATKGQIHWTLFTQIQKKTYKTFPHHIIGHSNQISIMLIPACRPHLNLSRAIQKQIRYGQRGHSEPCRTASKALIGTSSKTQFSEDCIDLEVYTEWQLTLRVLMMSQSLKPSPEGYPCHGWQQKFGCC